MKNPGYIEHNQENTCPCSLSLNVNVLYKNGLTSSYSQPARVYDWKEVVAYRPDISKDALWERIDSLEYELKERDGLLD